MEYGNDGIAKLVACSRHRTRFFIFGVLEDMCLALGGDSGEERVVLVLLIRHVVDC
jgi:hypothetical protein